jgi:hypothetical protein
MAEEERKKEEQEEAKGEESLKDLEVSEEEAEDVRAGQIAASASIRARR